MKRSVIRIKQKNMEEIWKELKTWKTSTNKQSLHCKGDILYISNTGKIRLNDIELTLEKGLYIDKKNQIQIVGTSWPYLNMHRTMWQLFKGDLYKGSNIHHIDGNHYNNHIDNLIQLTSYEHGSIHKGLQDKLYDEDWVKEQQHNADKVIKLTKQWLKSRVIEWLNNRRDIDKQKSIDKHIQWLNQKERDKQEKVNSGDYYIGKGGRLIKKNRSHKGRPLSEEHKKNIANQIHQLWQDGTLTTDKCIANKGKQRHFDEEKQKFYYS